MAENHYVDCGESDETILEFDHIQGKEFLIKKGLRHKPIGEVLAEIKKCVVRCPNCHRRRTYAFSANFGHRSQTSV